MKSNCGKFSETSVSYDDANIHVVDYLNLHLWDFWLLDNIQKMVRFKYIQNKKRLI